MTKDRCRRLTQAIAHLRVAATYISAVSAEEQTAAGNLPANIKPDRAGALETNAATLNEALALITKASSVVGRTHARSWASAARAASLWGAPGA